MNDLGVIHLSNRGFTVVDADLFASLNATKWGLDSKGYVFRSVGPKGKQKKIFLHRVVNQTPCGVHTDHRNGFPIDNTRRNLRNATVKTNGANRSKSKDYCTSKFKGVTWQKRDNRWKATITVSGNQIHLGLFKEEILAAEAYNAAALKHFGEFARLNEIP